MPKKKLINIKRTVTGLYEDGLSSHACLVPRDLASIKRAKGATAVPPSPRELGLLSMRGLLLRYTVEIVGVNPDPDSAPRLSDYLGWDDRDLTPGKVKRNIAVLIKATGGDASDRRWRKVRIATLRNALASWKHAIRIREQLLAGS